MLARRLWPAAGALLWCAFIAFIAFTAHAAEPGKPRWTLINPYPASGAADIAGSAVATRVLRTMQRHVNPSVTDAVARVAQQAVTEAFDAEVFQSRQSRASGQAAGETLASCLDCLLMLGSGLVSEDSAVLLRRLQAVALVADMPTVWVASPGNVSVREATQLPRIGLSGERGAAADWLRAIRGGAASPLAVTYNGGHGAVRAVLAHEVPTALLPLPAALPYLMNGRLRALALDAPARHPLLPAVPVATEAGVASGGVSGWYGLFSLTSQTVKPDQQVRLRAALRSADSMRELLALGLFPATGAIDELARYARHEFSPERFSSAAAPKTQSRSISSGGLTERNSASKDRS